METADRARLRHELQQAYAAWLLASQRDDFRDYVRDAVPPHDKPRNGPTVKDLWATYLAARERLIEATTGQSRVGPADAGTRGLI